MKVLTIHNDGHGFCWAIPGELAIPPEICQDSSCGCDRSFVGLNSRQASTAVEVADLDLLPGDVILAVTAFLEASGWGEKAAGLGAHLGSFMIANGRSVPGWDRSAPTLRPRPSAVGARWLAG